MAISLRKIIDKPYYFLKWKYFSYTTILILFVTTLVSFLVTKNLFEYYPEQFYELETNFVLRELINCKYGWIYAFFFFISGNFFISLLSFFKNIRLRLILCLVSLLKIYFAIFETAVILIMPYWFDRFGL